MHNIIEIHSISELHDFLGYGKPTHPLITLIEFDESTCDSDYLNKSFATDLYTVLLKKCGRCDIKYGRNYYDFKEGSLMFFAPKQVVKVDDNHKVTNAEGWILSFHPDLVARHSLGRKLDEYTFFSYNVNEALHMSENEKEIITNIVQVIKREFKQNIDIYSRDLIVSNIEVLLNYAKRFYGRQFITREHLNNDVIIRFENLLKEYFNTNQLEENGMPSVKYLAKEMGYSTNYFSDLLKKETGKNTLEHVHFHLIEKAKTMLLATSDPVSQIAYVLGFDYPSHFSKFFKSKTGVSPMSFRNQSIFYL